MDNDEHEEDEDEHEDDDYEEQKDLDKKGRSARQRRQTIDADEIYQQQLLAMKIAQQPKKKTTKRAKTEKAGESELVSLIQDSRDRERAILRSVLG